MRINMKVFAFRNEKEWKKNYLQVEHKDRRWS